MLDFAAQYAAFQRRDPAWDGIVFVAVKTTGVYCRPVCRARTPLARNVRFYGSAASAERAGFRPCLRCRPEAAPFCALDRGNVEALAGRLGVGARHLSRLFAEHLDASPLQVALSLRVQRAKRLIDGSELLLALVAQRAGFSSARRMNAAFAKLYGRSAASLRRKRPAVTMQRTPMEIGNGQELRHRQCGTET
ncbi:Ada metal-binding domain-containing protein [Bradyrhizobium elkanii]|uniref:Ada metal-binding domain-containing protein n=1 Tax=Bradyrhizobium elkanii TaxID=29448 RepID=UPI001448E97F|nr:Ada metal-binding domain-containing protein [Bradyrhizobium elkanii]BBC02884.1 transcriptional regulator AraC family [Bradyrhizobium elkanii USDA 61]